MKWFDLVYAHAYACRLLRCCILYFCVCALFALFHRKCYARLLNTMGCWGAWKRVELNTNLLPMCMRFILFIIRVYCFYYNTHIHTHEYEWLSNVGLWIFCSTPRASLLLLFFCFFLFIYFLRVSRKYYILIGRVLFLYNFFSKKNKIDRFKNLFNEAEKIAWEKSLRARRTITG